MTKIFSTTLFIFAALFATAQKDTLEGNKLDEVIVTANKYPQKQSTTGKVITVITREQIEKSSGRTVSQLLNEQAGITINGALSNLGANQTVYMRGAGSGRTLVLIDGIPVNDPTLITNDFDINLLSLNNVERIEIARGAQSTLYGSDAIAGVINMITIKNDVTKPVNVKTTLSGGTYGTYRGNIQLYGKENKLAYNMRYAKLTSGGFSAAYDSTGKNSFDKDGYNSDVISTSLQYQVNSNISLRSFIQYSRYKTDLDAGLFTDEKDYTVNNKSLMTGAGFNYKKNKVSVTGNYQYSENRREYLNDSLDQPTFERFSTDTYYAKSQFAELYSSIELSKNISWLQGIDYRYNSMHSNYYSLSSYGPYETNFKDTSLSQSSLYASLFYHGMKEKLNIELGGRLNKHSRYGSNQTFTFNPSYNFNEHLRVFGSVASGFKAPSLYQLYSDYGKQDLKPERSKTYEVGIQHLSQKINSRVLYFHRDIKDGIDFDNVNFKYFNYIKQTVNGAEFETKVEPLKNLTVTGNYTYLKPNEQSQSRVTFKDTTYHHLLRRPKHSFNLTVGYQFDNGLYISAAGKYVGNRYDAGGYEANDVLLDHYFLLNAYAEYKIKNYLKFFADAQNLTNEKFFDVRGYNSIPFLLNVGLTFNL
ncbi:MAG TPA: TonB-dependent receptor [Segetibacter sp.]|nr:TonB-dependent receptor [Segetibacter sp.]